MQQFVGRARILLLASHSADLCRSICNRALVLSKGEAVFFGDVEEGFKVYAGHLAAGRAEGREDGTPPNDWNEAQYLKIYPDVAAEVQRGTFLNGYHHYLTAGRAEGRKDGTPPSDWNEALYLRLYPDVAAEVQRGTFVSGYHHYLVAGWAEGRYDGKPPNNWNEELYLRVNPDVQHEVTRGTFLSGYHHYLVNGRSSAHRVDLR